MDLALADDGSGFFLGLLQLLSLVYVPLKVEAFPNLRWLLQRGSLLLPAVACVRCNESVVSRSIQTVSIGTVFGRKRIFNQTDKILGNLTGTGSELFSASRSVTCKQYLFRLQGNKVFNHRTNWLDRFQRQNCHLEDQLFITIFGRTCIV